MLYKVDFDQVISEHRRCREQVGHILSVVAMVNSQHPNVLITDHLREQKLSRTSSVSRASRSYTVCGG